MKWTPNRTKRQRSRCMFCWEPLTGNRSNEHVFPQWLLDRLGIRKQLVKPFTIDADHEIIHERQLTLGSLTVGKVCRTCNNGWMSALEAATVPILEGLVDGSVTVANLSDGERIILSRWACRTAYCIDASSYGKLRVPDRHPKKLWRDQNRIPERVAVFAMRSPFDVTIEWLEYNRWSVVYPRTFRKADAKRDLDASYKQAIQIRDLVLLVAFWPPDDYAVGFESGFHEAIYVQDHPFFETIKAPHPPYPAPADFLMSACYRLTAIPLDQPLGQLPKTRRSVKVFD